MRTNRISFCKSLLVALFFVNLGHSSPIIAAEEWLWQKAKPTDVGLNIEKLNKAHRMIKKGKYGLMDSMLVVRHGKLVYEKYYNQGYKTRPHQLASAGKSILSAVMGISLDKKTIDGVDKNLYDYFHQYFGSFEHWNKEKQAITLHNLLTMRAGWDCNIASRETRCGSLMKEDNRNALESLKWVLDRPMKHKPGEKMQYTDSIVSVLDIVLYLANGKPIEQIYQDDLLQPMGIFSEYQNKMTSRQMAMFGQLYLNRGTWDGKQIISEDWISKSTANIYPFTRSKPGMTQGYGYLWWIATFSSKSTDLVVNGYYASGNGGQYIVVLPDVDIIIVFTGGNFGEFKVMGETLGIVEEYILPAIVEK